MHKQIRQEPPRRRQGFTLIEIMAVVIIMGLLMGMVGVGIMGQLDKAKRQTARNQIKAFEAALELYYMDNSRYPTTEQGLEALRTPPSSGPETRNYPRGGYLRGSDVTFKDPWQQDYKYESPGQHNPDTFDLWSLGPDQQSGGDGSDADIGNWGSDESQS